MTKLEKLDYDWRQCNDELKLHILMMCDYNCPIELKDISKLLELIGEMRDINEQVDNYTNEQ